MPVIGGDFLDTRCLEHPHVLPHRRLEKRGLDVPMFYVKSLRGSDAQECPLAADTANRSKRSAAVDAVTLSIALNNQAGLGGVGRRYRRRRYERRGGVG